MAKPLEGLVRLTDRQRTESRFREGGCRDADGRVGGGGDGGGGGMSKKPLLRPSTQAQYEPLWEMGMGCNARQGKKKVD